MILNEDVASNLAEFLLQIKAIKLEPSKPFTWSSGWKSPIYCDNRVTLSFPAVRNFIRQQLAQVIQKEFKQPGTIAGVATGGIAHGVLVAQELGLPFVYVRPESKKHGLGNQVEGYLPDAASVVVVEDLISTGKSSLAVVDVLRNQGAQVEHMVSIFDYGFPQSEAAFRNANVQLVSLCDYPALVKKAVELEYIREKDMGVLLEWREAPDKWGL